MSADVLVCVLLTCSLNLALSADAAVIDPFSRRKTIPRTFYENLSSSRGVSPAPPSGSNTPILTAINAAIPEKLVLESDSNGTLKEDAKSVKVDDIIAEADFGIDIEV
jgi:hypothetical protein